MFCSQCGQELREEDSFCGHCGAPRQPQPEKPMEAVLDEMKLRRKGGMLGGMVLGVVAVAVIFALVVAFRVSGGLFTDSVEGSGFDTPEDAATAYLEDLKAGDMAGMLSAFAMETCVEHMDLEAYVERLQAYLPSTMPLPGDNAYVDALNLESRRASVSRALTWQYVTLTDPDSPILEQTPMGLEGQSAADLLRTLEAPDGAEALQSLRVGEFRQPETLSESYSTEENQANLEKQALCYGADAIQPLAVEVTVDGRTYLFCPNAARYGEKWYLLDLNGNLGVLLGAPATSGGLVSLDERF